MRIRLPQCIAGAEDELLPAAQAGHKMLVDHAVGEAVRRVRKRGACLDTAAICCEADRMQVDAATVGSGEFSARMGSWSTESVNPC